MIDIIAIALTSLVVFWLIHLFKLIPQCKDVLAAARQANSIGSDASLSDLEKEKQTQQAATQLMKLFVAVVIKSAGAFLLPIVPLYLLSLLDLLSLEHMIAIASSIEFIVVFCVLFVISLIKANRG